MMQLDVHLTDKVLKGQITTLVLNNDKALKRAFRRAAKKISRWMSTQVARSLSKQYGLQVSKFKRFRIRIANPDFEKHNKPAMVWFGVNDVEWDFIGDKPKQDDQGVWVKDYFFKGAFIGKNRKGITQVFKRRTAKRLPIDIQKVNIRLGAKIAVARLLNRAQARYKDILGQEVNYELSKLRN